MNMNPRAGRLYALVMLPVAVAVAWFFFFYDKGAWTPESVSKNPIVVLPDGRTFAVEIADTPDARTKGLGGRDELCEACVMLFRFGTPDRYPFWMNGMRFPLDIAWIRDGIIVHIERNIPADFPDVMTPDAPADSVLETNAGALSDVRIGDAVPFLWRE